MGESVYIRLFGNPEMTVNGTVVPIKRRKTMALLAFLATSPRSHSRENLAAMLWPDADQKHALAYLRNSLWELNQTPLHHSLDIDHRAVRLVDHPDTVVDIREFRQRLSESAVHSHSSGRLCAGCSEGLEQAIALPVDRFLSGFTLSGNSRFEQWLQLEEETCHRDYVKALHLLTDHYYYTRNWAAGSRAAGQWIAADPFDESACRHGMIIAVCSGQRNEAVRIYLRCRRVLEQELGVDPDPDTERFYQSVLLHSRPDDLEGVLAQSPDNDLPVALTPFLGRESELRELRQLMEESKGRLISIVGPGGSGKTRLAAEMARELRASFQHGVAWVSLETLTVSDPVIPLLFDAVNLRLSREDSSASKLTTHDQLRLLLRLKRFLQDRSMLIVLDNAEHLTTRLNFLTDLLTAAPGLRFLVTSRIVLNLSPEWVFTLGGLPCPSRSTTGDLESFPSIKLFMSAAHRRQPGRIFGSREIERICEICHLVNGNPLALELSAVWIDSLSISEILKEIQKDMGFLKSSVADGPARHQSLRTVFDYTWEQLSNSGKRVFRKLAIFSGGFNRTAARQITGAGLEDMVNLISRSIIRKTVDQRYMIHETLRQFAQEELSLVADEYSRVRSRHSRYYLSWVRDLTPSLGTYRQFDSVELMKNDFDNIRSAWLVAADNADIESLSNALDGLFFYFDIRSRFHQGWELFQRCRLILQGKPHLADVYHGSDLYRSFIARLQGFQAWLGRYINVSQSHTWINQSISVLTDTGPESAWAFMGVLRTYLGFSTDSPVDTALMNRCREVFRRVNNTWMEAFVLEGLALWSVDRPDSLSREERQVELDRRLDCCRKALSLRMANGDTWGLAMSYTVMALIAGDHGRQNDAGKYLQKSLMLRRKSGEDLDGIIDCLVNLARIELSTRRLKAAEKHAIEALQIATEIDNRVRMTHARDILDELVLMQSPDLDA